MDRGDAPGLDDDRIVAIQTQGHLMGNLLQKQGQAAQTLGYRLWTGAYFGSRDADERPALLEAAVDELQTGAHTQFLAAAALAATAGDEARQTAQSPYVENGLHRTRTHVQQARDVVESILADEKPTLAINEIMAGDEQIRRVIVSLRGVGTGSIIAARGKHTVARNALFRVQDSEAAVFTAEQQRQQGFLSSLETLTGLPINGSLAETEGVPPDEMTTVDGRARYLELVRARIDELMRSSDRDLLGFTDAGLAGIPNRLDDAVKQVAYQVREVANAKAELDRYPERIAIIEATLGENVSAVEAAEMKTTAAQLVAAVAGSVTLTKSDGHSISTGDSVTFEGTSASYGVSRGVSFSSGSSVSRNPGAVKAAEHQNEITRAANIERTRFLESDASARIRNLLLDQERARDELETQGLLLRHAEDAVRKLLGETVRILGQLRSYDEAVADLWYADPVWSLELTAAEEAANQAANQAIESVVRNLYKLGRLLEVRWIEPFANPVPVANGEPGGVGGRRVRAVYESGEHLLSALRERASRTAGPASRTGAGVPGCAPTVG